MPTDLGDRGRAVASRGHSKVGVQNPNKGTGWRFGPDSNGGESLPPTSASVRRDGRLEPELPHAGFPFYFVHSCVQLPLLTSSRSFLQRQS